MSPRATGAGSPRWPAGPGCGRNACSRSSNGASVPIAASIVIAATTSAVRASEAARATARMPIASMPCVPLTSASPSFGSRVSGVEAGPSHRRQGRLGAALGTEHLPVADQRQGEVRERCEVARRTQRSLLRHRRHDILVEHLHHEVDDRRPHTRMTEGEDVGAQQQHRARFLTRERSADGGGVRAHDAVLQRRGLRRIDPHVGQRPEPGRDPVDRGARRDGAHHHLVRGLHPDTRIVVEPHRRTVRDGDDVLERQRPPPTAITMLAPNRRTSRGVWVAPPSPSDATRYAPAPSDDVRNSAISVPTTCAAARSSHATPVGQHAVARPAADTRAGAPVLSRSEGRSSPRRSPVRRAARSARPIRNASVVLASNQQFAPALPPARTTPASQASRRTASSPCTRHTASMFAVLPPCTRTTSWLETNPRRSSTVRSNSARSDGSNECAGNRR